MSMDVVSRRKSLPFFHRSVLATGIALAIFGQQALAAPSTASDAAPVTMVSGAMAYSFDSKLLQGSSLGVSNIERFNKSSTVDPGQYEVDIYVNDSFLSRKTVEFREMAGGDVEPCLRREFLVTAGISAQHIKPDDGAADQAQAKPRDNRATDNAASPAACVALAQRVDGASTSFDLPRLRLNLSVPQALMSQAPRGAVDIHDLDAGRTMAYVNYDTNYYTSSAAGHRLDSFYAGINAGLNVGLWRLHQQSAYSYVGGSGDSRSRWDNIRTYAERPLPAWRSQLTVGDSYTSGNLLGAVGFRGIHLETDDRTLPDSMRGYAPVVSGVASTNARIVVSQNGNPIYQTTVAPGPFKITDLYPTSYQGDLTVQVFEANGQVSSFVVPFSAVPNSMRPGVSHYSVTLGQVRQLKDSHASFVDATYERGLTNMLTADAAARVNSDYQSVLGGIVLGTRVGAFGVNAAFSNARDAQGNRVQGWRGSANYSHTVQATQTTFSLAGYHYSTEGYRDFLDALGSRAAYLNGGTWNSLTYQQRDQFTVNINQSFDSYGTLSLSAALSNYYGAKSRDTQAQLSYNNHYKSIGYNLSFIRQQTGAFNYNGIPNAMLPGGLQAATPGFVGQGGFSGKMSNTILATVSIPLGNSPRSASLSGGVTHASGQGTQYQASLAGVADEARTLSFGVTASDQSQGGSASVSGNLQKSLPFMTVGASYAHGDGYWQAGASARGAAVLHGGGITLGPYLSDTFGIVEAKGAEGATVVNGIGARINSFGYALIPSLTPYRYNDVALDTQGINLNAELAGNQVKVAPYAGSAVLVKFKTLTGHALLIKSAQANGEPLPLGADVLNSDGAAIGMVGQGGQVYARAPADSGVLTVKWGDQRQDQCAITYDVPTKAGKQALYNLDAVCNPVRVN